MDSLWKLNLERNHHHPELILSRFAPSPCRLEHHGNLLVARVDCLSAHPLLIESAPLRIIDYTDTVRHGAVIAFFFTNVTSPIPLSTLNLATSVQSKSRVFVLAMVLYTIYTIIGQPGVHHFATKARSRLPSCPLLPRPWLPRPWPLLHLNSCLPPNER